MGNIISYFFPKNDPALEHTEGGERTEVSEVVVEKAVDSVAAAAPQHEVAEASLIEVAVESTPQMAEEADFEIVPNQGNTSVEPLVEMMENVTVGSVACGSPLAPDSELGPGPSEESVSARICWLQPGSTCG